MRQEISSQSEHMERRRTLLKQGAHGCTLLMQKSEWHQYNTHTHTHTLFPNVMNAIKSGLLQNKQTHIWHSGSTNALQA